MLIWPFLIGLGKDRDSLRGLLFAQGVFPTFWSPEIDPSSPRLPSDLLYFITQAHPRFLGIEDVAGTYFNSSHDRSPNTETSWACMALSKSTSSKKEIVESHPHVHTLWKYEPSTSKTAVKWHLDMIIRPNLGSLNEKRPATSGGDVHRQQVFL